MSVTPTTVDHRDAAATRDGVAIIEGVDSTATDLIGSSYVNLPADTDVPSLPTGRDRTTARVGVLAGEAVRRPGWIYLLLVTSARVLLAFVTGMILWATIPALIGWRSDVVLTGSMGPRISPGDVVVSEPVPASSVRAGQVISFDDPNVASRTVIHRIRSVNPDGTLITRGDANPTDDSHPVASTAIHGLGRLCVRFVALPVVWAREGALLPLGLTLFVLVSAIVLVLRDRDDDLLDENSEDDDDHVDDVDDLHDLDDLDDLDDLEPPDAKAETPNDDADTTANDGGDRVEDIQLENDDEIDHTRLVTSMLNSALNRLTIVIRMIRVPTLLRMSPIAATFAVAMAMAVVLGAAFSAFAATASDAGNAWKISPYAQFGAGTYVTEVNNSGPLFFYRLNEASGTTAADASGSGNPGTYVGGWNYGFSPQPLPRNVGLAVSSKNNTSCIASPVQLNNPKKYSYEMWFRTTSTSGGKLAAFEGAQIGTSSNYDRHLYMTNTGKLVFGVWLGSPTVITSPLSYNDGAWHQAAVTMGTTGGMQLFVDGFSVVTSANTASENFKGYWRFGCGSLGSWPNYPTDPSSTNFDGAIADISVYAAELTPTAIRTHYFAA